jgi:hypothetical protein
MPFCPSCGLNTAEAGRPPMVATDAGNEPVDALGRPLDDGTSTHAQPDASSATGHALGGSRVSSTRLRRLADPASRGSAIVIGAVIVAAGLVIFGLLMRPQPGTGPAAASPGLRTTPGLGGPGVSAGPPALIVGLTIESPVDGQVVATKDVTVIGLAPPGLAVTRDVSFGFDQHATADGTGHWAMSVGLDEGQNNLVFRIGDDRSTEQRLRVTYTPQAP